MSFRGLRLFSLCLFGAGISSPGGMPPNPQSSRPIHGPAAQPVCRRRQRDRLAEAAGPSTEGSPPHLARRQARQLPRGWATAGPAARPIRRQRRFGSRRPRHDCGNDFGGRLRPRARDPRPLRRAFCRGSIARSRRRQRPAAIRFIGRYRRPNPAGTPACAPLQGAAGTSIARIGGIPLNPIPRIAGHICRILRRRPSAGPGATGKTKGRERQSARKYKGPGSVALPGPGSLQSAPIRRPASSQPRPRNPLPSSRSPRPRRRARSPRPRRPLPARPGPRSGRG